MSRPKPAPYAAHPNGRLSDTEYRERINTQKIDAKHPVAGTMPASVHPTLVRDVIRLVDFSGLVPVLERRLRSHLGFGSQLTVRALLVAIVCVAGELKKYLRTSFAEFFAGLDPQIAVDLGLQNIEGTLPQITYNIVHKQLKRLEADLKSGWRDEPTGQWCNGDWFSDQKLLASVPIRLRERVTAVAVDGTDFPTHALCRIFDKDNNRLTDTIIDPEKETKRAAEHRRKHGLPEPEDPYEYEETEDEDTNNGKPRLGEIGTDGRLIRGKDTEARVGHHSATNSRRAGFYLGFEVNPVVAVPGGKWHGDYDKYHEGDEIDGYVLALGVAAAGTNPGPIGYKAIQAARRIAPNITEVVADRGFTTKRLTFNRPLHQDGLEVIMDYKQQVIDTPQVVSLGKRGDTAILHAGTLLHRWTPPEWQTPGKLAIQTIANTLRQNDIDGGEEAKTDAKYTELATQQWYAKRARIYAYAVHSHQTKGRKRVLCPVHAGKAAIPATNRTSPNKAVRIKVPQGTKGLCCEPGPVTVQADQLDQFQSIPYGTPAQQASYHRRNKVESVIGILKNDGGLGKQSCRAFGLIPRQIAATAIAVVYNMQLTRAAKERAAEQRAAEKATDADATENSQLDDIDDSQPTSEADLGKVTDDNFSEAPGGIPPPT